MKRNGLTPLELIDKWSGRFINFGIMVLIIWMLCWLIKLLFKL